MKESKKEVLEHLVGNIEKEEKSSKRFEFFKRQGFSFIHSDGQKEYYYLDGKKRMVEVAIKSGYSDFTNVKFWDEKPISSGMRTALLRIKYLQLNGFQYLEDYE